MEFKLRANVILSKSLTVEANDLKEAMEKAGEIMSKPMPYRDMTPRSIYYDEISPLELVDK
jgi:hypothetical protein